MSGEVWADLIQNYYSYAIGFGAFLSGAVVFYKRVLKPMAVLVKRYYDTLAKIDKIFDEITPNGGTSIKDKIDRIDKGLCLVQQVQHAMAADDEAMLFRTDTDGVTVWVNRTYTRAVGKDTSEILGNGWQNSICQDRRDKIVAEWYRSIKEKREFSMRVSFVDSDGEHFEGQVRSYKMSDSKGDIIGYWGHIQILK